MTSPMAAIGTTTTPTTATTPTTGTPAAATGGTQSLLNPQAFLQLLVAQLKYQDPTNPTDTSAFMNQTAMLSQVQTMSSMSSTLTSLATAQQTQTATAMIGRQVTYTDPAGARVTGLATSVNLLATGATVQVDGKTVPLSSIVAVAEPHS